LKNGKSAGKRMAKFKLKDLHGGVHAILFPGELDKYRDQVAEDRLVFAKGKIDFRRVEEPTLKCDLIVPIERATEELTGSVTIALKAPGLEDRTIHALKDLVLAHPGGCPILLEVATGDHHRALIRAAADFMVTPTHRFLQDVEELVGEGSVRLSAR
ncbi:MAG: OB-fold nucleic acid binding domain-containing protein, partial [Planctomycetota bacterium]